MSKIPLYTQTTHDWHCNKNQPNKPYAVDLNVGTNEYIFGRVTPNNQFIVSTGLVNNPKPYGIQMVGGKKSKSKTKSKAKPKSKSKSKKGGNCDLLDSSKRSLSVYNENNYRNNELIYNALDKINKLNGLNSPCKNSMIDAQNNIVGGKKNVRKSRKMKGGQETKGATGMPPQYYASKMQEKVTETTSVKPNDSAVLNLAPYSDSKVGGKKSKTKKSLKKIVTKKKSTIKKPVKKTTTVKKPVRKTTTKKTTTKKPVRKTTTKKTTTKKSVKKSK